MSARLPQPGGDDGNWGDLLNTFLQVSHDQYGAVLPAAIGSAGGVLSVNGKTPSSGSVTLLASDVGAGTYSKPSGGIPAADLDSATINAIASPNAVALQGTAVGSGTPSDGQALIYNASASAWVPSTVTSSGSVSDATSGSKGIVQLAGDLSGSAAAPSVAKIKGIALPSSAPTTGQVLAATGATATAWTTPSTTTTDSTKLAIASNLSDLGSASTARTNLGLGTAAVISATAGGDLSGTLPSPTVAKVNGVAVTGTPAANQVLTATSATAATWQAASAGASLTVKDEGTNLTTAAASINFTGSGVTATSTSGAVTVTIPGASSSGGSFTAVAKSANYTASSYDFVLGTATSGFTVTLPTASNGAWVRVKKIDASGNAIIVVGQNSATIDGSASQVVNSQYQSQDFMSDGTNWYMI